MSQYTLLVYIVGECLHPLTFRETKIVVILSFFYVWIFIRKNKGKYKGFFPMKIHT